MEKLGRYIKPYTWYIILTMGIKLLGAVLEYSGSSQSGVIIAFLQYFVMILNAMLGITRIFVMWSRGGSQRPQSG